MLVSRLQKVKCHSRVTHLLLMWCLTCLLSLPFLSQMSTPPSAPRPPDVSSFLSFPSPDKLIKLGPKRAFLIEQQVNTRIRAHRQFTELFMRRTVEWMLPSALCRWMCQMLQKQLRSSSRLHLFTKRRTMTSKMQCWTVLVRHLHLSCLTDEETLILGSVCGLYE